MSPLSLDTIERRKRRRKRRELMKKFGIHESQYSAMLDEQNHVCAICGSPEICDRDLCVDHCHTSGKVRGLLCTNCNMALGKFQDNVEYLRKAIEYLERDYTPPSVTDDYVKIDHNDRPNWKLLVTTPDGKFASLEDARKYYNVHSTTVRSWCMPDSKWKRDGFSCEKVFISLNQLRGLINEDKSK